MPLIVYDSVGNPVWNSDTVSGGVFADVKVFQPNDAITIDYKSFTGRTAYVIPMEYWPWPSSIGVSVDTLQGWPRLTVVNAAYTRKIALLIL